MTVSITDFKFLVILTVIATSSTTDVGCSFRTAAAVRGRGRQPELRVLVVGRSFAGCKSCNQSTIGLLCPHTVPVPSELLLVSCRYLVMLWLSCRGENVTLRYRS